MPLSPLRSYQGAEQSLDFTSPDRRRNAIVCQRKYDKSIVSSFKTGPHRGRAFIAASLCSATLPELGAMLE